MNLPKIILAPVFLLLILALAVPAQSTGDDKQLFVFKFVTNQPLVYAVSVKTKTITDTTAAGKTTEQKSASEVRYKARFSPYRKNSAGATPVYFKPYHVEEDLDNTGANHIVTEIRGLKIKSLQNGITIIDSERNIGLAEAKTMKLGVYPVMLTGYFDFDGTGKISNVEGDLPFVDHWTEALKEKPGYFTIIFPGNAVAVGDTWAQEKSMTSSGGITLDNPLPLTLTFTREKDVTDEGKPIAVFDMVSSGHLTNLGGTFEQKGQKSSLNISEYDHKTLGTYHFDQKSGQLLESVTTEAGDVTLQMLVQGNTVTSRVHSASEIQITLIPETGN